jgi:hypothetical protein
LIIKPTIAIAATNDANRESSRLPARTLPSKGVTAREALTPRTMVQKTSIKAAMVGTSVGTNAKPRTANVNNETTNPINPPKNPTIAPIVTWMLFITHKASIVTRILYVDIRNEITSTIHELA